MNTDNPNLSSQERRNNELELAKTAGSPAFFAPELCGISMNKDLLLLLIINIVDFNIILIL